MANVLAWILFFLGVGHIIFGMIKFKTPLAEAVSAGFFGQFSAPEIRRTALWFILLGPLLMFAGHVAIRAVAVADFALLRILGIYLLLTALAGVAAFPRSPFWAPLLLAPLFIATGYGWI